MQSSPTAHSATSTGTALPAANRDERTTAESASAPEVSAAPQQDPSAPQPSPHTSPKPPSRSPPSIPNRPCRHRQESLQPRAAPPDGGVPAGHVGAAHRMRHWCACSIAPPRRARSLLSQQPLQYTPKARRWRAVHPRYRRGVPRGGGARVGAAGRRARQHHVCQRRLRAVRGRVAAQRAGASLLC